jgi:hypothetical protein
LDSILPPAFSIIDTETVDISGHILTESKILSLRIDGKPVKFSGSKFMISSLPLSVGKNVFIFEIFDSTGKRKFYSYTLYRKEELEEEAGPLPEATGSHETETKKVLSIDTNIAPEGFTPALIASKSSPVTPVSTPSTSGYRIKNDDPQVISVVQQITGGVTGGAGSTNNSNPRTDPVQMPVLDNKEEPMLSFSSPYKDQIITENALQIGGRFNEFAHVKSITIGGRECTISPASFTFTGPTLLSPGEARRRNIVADSPEYIIMKVDPVTHSGKNILTAQVTDDAGHVKEEKITFYYYQLFVKMQSTGENYVFPPIYVDYIENGRHRRKNINYFGQEKQIKLEINYNQMFNRDLFSESPFANWSDIKSNMRTYFPYGPPFSSGWIMLSSVDSMGFCYYVPSYGLPSCTVSNYPWLSNPFDSCSDINWEYKESPGRLWGMTVTTLHSPPVKDNPFIVIFKNCDFIETFGPFLYYEQPLDPSKYKINGKYPLNPLFDPADRTYNLNRSAYIIMENPNPDTDIDITMEAPSYGDGFGYSPGYCNKFFSCYNMQTLSGDILVDSNNDGFLGGDDNAVEQVAPGCVNWVNNDDDYDESNIHSDDACAVNSNGNDGYDGNINGIRDLEDFMPINLTIPNIKEWTTNQNVKFYLKAEGSGRIKIFERVKDIKKIGSFTYLKDINSSIAQFTKPIIINLASGDKKELESKYFDDNGNFRAIFEGIEQGVLELSLIVELGENKTEAILDEAYVTLKSIRDMYRFVDVRGAPSDGSDGKLRYRTINVENKNMFIQDPSKVFMFIHGAWTPKSDAVTWSNTVYKRLYRSGYRGGFIGFSWDTAEGIYDPIPLIGSNNFKTVFDNQWVNSFQTGQVLADVIENTKNEFKNAKINLVAHSLGGNLTSYALKLLAIQDKRKIVNNVFLVQVAVSGNTYATRQENDYYKDMYVSAAANNITGKVYNLYYSKDKLIRNFSDNLIGVWWSGLIGNLDYGLPVPLDNNYEVLPSNRMYGFCDVGLYRHEKSMSGGLGNQNLESKLSNFMSRSYFRGNIRPFGIRDHLSFGTECYYDVQEYFGGFLNPKNLEKWGY